MIKFLHTWEEFYRNSINKQKEKEQDIQEFGKKIQKDNKLFGN